MYFEIFLLFFFYKYKAQLAERHKQQQIYLQQQQSRREAEMAAQPRRKSVDAVEARTFWASCCGKRNI